MRNFIDSLKARKAASENESGFSLIDVVVTVAIIVALSVGGFVAYSGIVDSAKAAATTSAADQVRTALVVADNDNDPATDHNTVLKSYNDSANGSIVVTETTKDGKKYVTATHADFKTDGSTPKLQKDILLG